MRRYGWFFVAIIFFAVVFGLIPREHREEIVYLHCDVPNDLAGTDVSEAEAGFFDLDGVTCTVGQDDRLTITRFYGAWRETDTSGSSRRGPSRTVVALVMEGNTAFPAENLEACLAAMAAGIALADDNPPEASPETPDAFRLTCAGAG